MTFTQSIAPNPNIPCEPGWCLAYVNEAFGVPKVYPSATSAWFASKTKHTGRDFPPGVWVPVWYGLDTTPLGHVVLLAPDGTVYSTSDLTNIPHHHPNLADLEAYYAYYNMTLTYRGWTEDVEGTRVIEPTGLAAMGENITPIKEDELSAAEVKEIKDYIHALFIGGYTSAGEDRPGIADDVRAIRGRTDRYLDAPTSAVPGKVWGETVTRGGKQISVKQELADSKSLSEKAAATIAASVALAKNDGLTSAQITAAVQAALSDVSVDFTLNGGK